jgi:hypothetical protein
MAGIPGPFAVRMERPRCRGAGNRSHSADDVRDVPDPPVSPCGRCPEGGDDAAALRRTLHAGTRRRREPQRARRRGPVAAGARAPRDARGGSRDHPGTVGRRTGHVSRQAFRRRIRDCLGSAGNRPADRNRSVGAGELSPGGAPRRRDGRSRASTRARSDVRRRRWIRETARRPDRRGLRPRRASRAETRAGSVPLVHGRLAGQRRAPASGVVRRGVEDGARRRRHRADAVWPRRATTHRRHPRVRGCGVHPHRAGAGGRGLAKGVHLVGGVGAAACAADEISASRCRVVR